MPLAFCFGVATTLFLIVGCGPKDVGGVSGTVTLGGQPLDGAMITFSPTKEGGSSGVGQTDSAGYYTLSYSAGVKGAQQGENEVRITTFREAEPDGDPSQPAVPEKVPAKYNVKTELKVEVKSGSNKLDFNLEPGPIIQPGDQDQPRGKRTKRGANDC